jgi:hypothetical protein
MQGPYEYGAVMLFQDISKMSVEYAQQHTYREHIWNLNF